MNGGDRNDDDMNRDDNNGDEKPARKKKSISSLDMLTVGRIVTDSLDSPKTKLLRRMRSPGAGKWWVELVDRVLHEDLRRTEPFGPTALPTPSELIALKDLGKSRGAAPTDLEQTEAAALYFAATLLFDGHPQRPPSERISSLDWRELDEVYATIQEALDEEWKPVTDRALLVNEESR